MMSSLYLLHCTTNVGSSNIIRTSSTQRVVASFTSGHLINPTHRMYHSFGIQHTGMMPIFNNINDMNKYHRRYDDDNNNNYRYKDHRYDLSMTGPYRMMTSSSSSGGGNGDDDDTKNDKTDTTTNRRHHHQNTKSNFDRDVLLPSSRGELVGNKPHTSGIPKLASRQKKVHLHPISKEERVSTMDELYDEDRDRYEMNDDDDNFDPMNENDAYDSDSIAGNSSITKALSIQTRRNVPSSNSAVAQYAQPSIRNKIDSIYDPSSGLMIINEAMTAGISPLEQGNDERDIQQMSQLVQEAIRCIAELTVLSVSDNNQDTVTKNPENDARQEQVMNRLRNIKQYIHQKEYQQQFGGTDSNKNNRLFKINQSKIISNQFAETHLPNGLKSDFSPSIGTTTTTNATNLSDDTSKSTLSLGVGGSPRTNKRNSLSNINIEAVKAYARALELDVEFGYWCEMDYDIKEAKAKHRPIKDTKKKKVKRRLDGIDPMFLKPPSQLTSREKQLMAGAMQFGKENCVLEYLDDPALVDDDEVITDRRMKRKVQDYKQLLASGSIQEEPEDERDILYENHPNFSDLCSGIYEYIEVDAQHPHQKREPKPHFRRSIVQPDDRFIKRYKRFAFVDNIPPINTRLDDPSVPPPKTMNPVDRTIFQRHVGRIFNVEIDQVYPASPTSAYIGYKNSLGLARTLIYGPDDKVVKQFENDIPPPTFQMLPKEYENHKFVTSSIGDTDNVKKCIVLLSNLDLSGGQRYTSISLARDLFGRADSATYHTTKNSFELEDIATPSYGNITADDIHIVTATSALIRLASPDQATSVINSKLLRDRVRLFNRRGTEGIGITNIQVFRARRELVHAYWIKKRVIERGTEEYRKFGKRLIVDGDMPTKAFYTSHAGVIMLSNVNPLKISKLDISNFVQPYCTLPRDVEGSIEWVECNHYETRTDRVYVGFDLSGEAEKVIEAVGGSTRALNEYDIHQHPILVKLIHDRQPPNYPAPTLERRPDRTIDELLDDLNGWEKYVDPADIEHLENAGISKHVLDEALRGFRYSNDSFGPLDQAMRHETLEPNLGTGQQYRDLVQIYIRCLKECIATQEDPGDTFKALHFPNQEYSFGVFDRERKRLDHIKDERQRLLT